MSKPERRRRGPIYWLMEEFKLFDRSDIRFSLWGISIIFALSAVGFVVCAVFKLC